MIWKGEVNFGWGKGEVIGIEGGEGVRVEF
jgi:hypothetical protein